MSADGSPVQPGLLAELRTAPDTPLRAEFERFLAEDAGRVLRDAGPRHLTASAIVADATGEHTALLWHRKGRFWVNPGGHLDPGEDAFEQAARREVREETGLSGLERVGAGPALVQRHGLDAGFGRCAEHWDVVFLLRAPGRAADVPLRASEESAQVRWVPWAGPLPPGTVPDLPVTLERLARLATS